jgi:hypothetical protein
MFYSANEIFFMSKSHGTELQHSCENHRNSANKKKPSRSFRLLQGLVAVILPIRNKL